MFLVRQTKQHVLFTGRHRYINTRELSKEIHVGVVITAWRRNQFCRVKRKLPSNMRKNTYNQITLRIRKVSSLHLFSISTFSHLVFISPSFGTASWLWNFLILLNIHLFRSTAWPNCPAIRALHYLLRKTYYVLVILWVNSDKCLMSLCHYVVLDICGGLVCI